MLVLIWLAVRLKSVQIQLNTDGQVSDAVGGPTEQHFNHNFQVKMPPDQLINIALDVTTTSGV